MSESPHLQPGWDEIVASFATGTVFHTTAWLEFLRETQGVEPIVEPFKIGDARGYHVAAKVKKGPFTILGSPLPGWTTVRMGPLFNPDEVDQRQLVASVDDFARRNKASMLELANENLDGDALAADKFERQPDGTFMVDLPADSEALWDNLRSTARNRVRKARKNGLTVEFGADDALVDEVWERVEAIFRHQGLSVPYDHARVKRMYEALAPAGKVTGIRVKAPDGHIAACGIFPFDHDTIYFWAGAARAEDRALVPNELMHFELMSHAIDLGLKRYDMCGGGDYKKKFGAYAVDNPHWIRYYNPVARLGRAAMAGAIRAKRAISARFKSRSAG